VLLDDFDHAEAIFVIGQNPGTNSPRMMTELHKASRRGVPIVVINPLRECALERFEAPPPGQSSARQRKAVTPWLALILFTGNVLVLDAHAEALPEWRGPGLMSLSSSGTRMASMRSWTTAPHIVGRHTSASGLPRD
jgi:hypothetical protein